MFWMEIGPAGVLMFDAGLFGLKEVMAEAHMEHIEPKLVSKRRTPKSVLWGYKA